ncbi:multicopper oxidase family protein [Lysinibacillus sp. NPDC097287]|uniref:multicopper oxidase family protein n=1 Tax=Lysinibacillus sp. NPDC097287 TaxID=3364144 RepID=UPI00381161F4
MYKDVNPSDPNTIPKFVDQLQKPTIARSRNNNGYPRNSYYELQMKEARHRFHKHFRMTTIWGYDGLCPGPTIEAEKDQTTYVKYNNRLPTKHFLPVDFTLHSANDSQEVRTVVHLHGANVDWESDGNPESWYSRDYIHTGPKFKREVHEYTNHQPGTTMWYHDHTMGITRLNVYAGLAGFYLLRDSLEERLQLPCGPYEIPLMIQDRSFNEDGSIFYPDAPPFPVPVHPSITPGFVGNTITVNGKVWPYLSVEPRKYRFRIVNASNRRGYVLSLSNEQPLIQLGTDGGFLAEPIIINSIELLPAERTDIIVDFSNLECQEITLVNTDTEFPGEHTSIVLQFRVDLPLKGEDTSLIPERLAESMDLHEHHAHIQRDLPLSATLDNFGRPMLLLNGRMYHEPTTEKPSLDSIEVWNIINVTPFPHPIHVHLVQFKILERRPFNVELYQNEGKLEYTGDPEEPRDYERGWKDTVKTDAGMVTKIIMHWKEHTGHYMWHCHFLEHEDHDMMRPILVIKDVHPVQQPHAVQEHATDTPNVTTAPLINTQQTKVPPIEPQDTKIPTTTLEDTAEPHEDNAGNTKTKLSKYLQYQSVNQRNPTTKKRNKRR